MIEVSDSIILHRSVADVFAVVADPEHQLEWDSETLKRVEKLTRGPLERGARYRGEFSGLGVVEYEFAEYVPPRRFAHRTSMRMGEINHTFAFETVPEGTQLTQTSTLKPRGLWKLIAPFLRGMLRNRLRTMNTEIQSYLGDV